MAKNAGNDFYVKDYAIAVSVPMYGLTCNTLGCVGDVEKMFIAMRDYAIKKSNIKQAQGCDRIRALLKYATVFNATRCRVKVENESLDVTVYFRDIESMKKFENGMNNAVESAVMK